MLTLQQAELLDFIKRYQASHKGASPSFREMADELGVKSVANIDRLLAGLVERKTIKRVANRARAIQVLNKEM